MKTDQTDLEIIDKAVTEFVKKTGISPFKNIEEKGENELAVDVDAEFEKEIAKACKDVNKGLGKYFEMIIKETIDSLELEPNEKDSKEYAEKPLV